MARRKSDRLDQGRRFRVPFRQLCWKCPLDRLTFKTTTEIPPQDRTIGQLRAVAAIKLGLEIHAAGYNMFVTGPVGTGRTTTVRQLLATFARASAALSDKCYVNNFRDPDQPRLLRLPSGKGRDFKREMDQFIDFLIKSIPMLFESDKYQHSRQEVVDSFKEQGSGRVRDFENKIAAEGFALVQTAPFTRPELAPIVEKQPVRIEALQALMEGGKLTKERADEIRAKYRELATGLAAIFKEIREYERQARDALTELDHNVVRPVLEERQADIEEKFQGPELPPPTAGTASPEHGSGVKDYLAEVKEAILSRIDLFRQKPPERERPEMLIDPYLEFRVNVLVDNTDIKHVPVIFETNPTYKNLFGYIDRAWDRGGQWRADFTRIKAGSLLKADSGFLVINAIDALVEPGVWPALKRSLRNRQLEITGGDPYSALFGVAGMKPEPIDVDLKVIMIGDAEVYSLLAAYDEDFKKIFKVRADFDWVMGLDDDATREYVQVIKALCEREQLMPFDRSGVRGIVEYGVRLAGKRNKISTRFNVISEVLTEACFWAHKERAKAVKYEHVARAIDTRRDRVRLYEEKLQELINEGTIFIDVSGSSVGQVNGLAVYDTGEHAFGVPTRITAKTGVGSAGIINIEREAQLSGPTHDKGVYILAGYLRHKYAQRRPLVLSASITFEQSYGGVDGDSASSTEVYALLSDLAGLPVRQDLAVTGSVNQKGEVQPIGGVNWKIEGFFDACRARGLTGTQGVVIPRANLQELMLRSDVVDAVKNGKFRIYAVATIDEGIELLTGVGAGTAGKDGEYPPDSVNGRVGGRLAELAELYSSFKAEKEGKNSEQRPRTKKPEKHVRKRRRSR